MSIAGTVTSASGTRAQVVASNLPAIDSLTSLRGFLALWVVFYHFWKDALLLFPSAKIATPVVSHGNLAVPAFFMLSGFVLAYNYAPNLSTFGFAKFARFLFMRAARIYPVHLASLIVVLAMVLVCRVKGWSLTDAGYGGRDFALNLLLVQTWVPRFHLNWNYPSWSISSEWFAYLAFPVLCATVLRRITTQWQACGFLVLCWVLTIALYSFGDSLPFYEMICVIPTFLAGTALFTCVTRRFGQARDSFQYVPDLLLLALAVILLATTGRILVGFLLSGFLVLIYSLACQGDKSSWLWTNRLARYLGEISYSLYMAHALAQKVCYKLLPADRFADGPVVTRLAVAMCFAATIAFISLGMYYLVERPSRKRLRRWASLGVDVTNDVLRLGERCEDPSRRSRLSA